MPDVQLRGRNAKAGPITLVAGTKSSIRFLNPVDAAGNALKPSRAVIQLVGSAAFALSESEDTGDAAGANWFTVPADVPFALEINTVSLTVWMRSAAGATVRVWQV